MSRILAVLITLICATSALAAEPSTSKERQDLYFKEALYHAFQQDWFEAIARLDTELAQHRGLDEPELDVLFNQLGQAEFNVGDYELAYRMHQRAGRAILAVIEGDVEESVRNGALYRLARIYYRKGQPLQAYQALERIHGATPASLVDDLPFLRAEVLMATGRFDEAAALFKSLLGRQSLAGFTPYNLGIALIRDGKVDEGRQWLDRAGQIEAPDQVTAAIRDKANLVLGEKLLAQKQYEEAKLLLDRVRLTGPFSYRALLGSGWADAYRGYYDRALVPWTLLSEGEVTDLAVQESLLAVPFAYARIGLYSNAALLYGWALETFDAEADKLDASIASIRDGKFLQALAREELSQDANWVVRLRALPKAPETFYLLDLLAANDFQESLKNYLDLEMLRRKLDAWEGDLQAFEEIIALRRAYYQPLLPEIDAEFGKLDARMRLRLEQRDSIAQRLQALLVAPRPEDLATAAERQVSERLTRLERSAAAEESGAAARTLARISRLRGVLTWSLRTTYDQRLTETYTHLRDLDEEIDWLNQQHTSFVRSRQAAPQSYQGYDETIRRQRQRIADSRDKVRQLIARQGRLLEGLAVDELTRRRERLAEFQIKARFAMADSYDRANQVKERKEAQP